MTGPPTYTPGLTIERSPYGRIINPAGFFKRLEQAQQSSKTNKNKGEEDSLSRQ